MTAKVTRRQAVVATAAAVLAGALEARLGRAADGNGGVTFGPRAAFSFDGIKDMARRLAASPWVKPETAVGETLEKIDYDAFQQIRYRPELTLNIDRDGRYPAQLFHLGKYFKDPVRMFVVAGGESREVLYSPSLFDIPAGNPARTLPPGLGFAGFRIMGPGLKSDWYAALGASYFRTSGPYDQYGLSARGLAIDTGLATPEEFPRFSHYWLEAADGAGGALTIYAVLDSPSCTGAYRMRTERITSGSGIHRIVQDIDCELFARKTITRLGIAPFSSMFWYGEASRNQVRDWRPEIHDSDGLAILTGRGERIWRPLNNPPRVITSTFLDNDPKGFGLLQRDRDFVHYLDDGVFYERRASVWVEPKAGFGAGAVHLVEIPTIDETDDNIVAYWCPDAPFEAGTTRAYSYRLSWLDDIDFPEALGRSVGTWIGLGGRPGQPRPPGVRKFVIDFMGPVFHGLGREDGVEIVATATNGTVSHAYCHPVVDQRDRWRAIFDIVATGSEPVDMRAFLRLKDRALTETWIYQYLPGT